MVKLDFGFDGRGIAAKMADPNVQIQRARLDIDYSLEIDHPMGLSTAGPGVLAPSQIDKGMVAEQITRFLRATSGQWASDQR